MMEQVEKKGMSKGCMIGLIVVGVLIVIVVVGMMVCYSYKDDLIKFGVKTMVSGVKVQLAEQPEPVVDTVAFNVLADAFILKIDESEIEPEKLAAFAQSAQPMMADNVIDSDEVIWFVEAMIEYYPELEELAPPMDEAAEETIEDQFDSSAAE